MLGFSAREVATILGTTVASANGALNRARRRFRERRPDPSQQSTLRDLGNGRVRELVERVVRAFEAGDVEEILALLAEDASFSMPPYPGWCQGRDALTDSWLIPETAPFGAKRQPPPDRSFALEADPDIASGWLLPS